MRGKVIGHWIVNREKKRCVCSKCRDVCHKRFKRCPSCNAFMRNGLITFMEEYDGREVSEEITD